VVLLFNMQEAEAEAPRPVSREMAVEVVRQMVHLFLRHLLVLLQIRVLEVVEAAPMAPAEEVLVL
jgi:hypothetical protein